MPSVNNDTQRFWYVYVLRSQVDGNFYVGTTKNLQRRLSQHRWGQNVSTAKRVPFDLVYFGGHLWREDALRRERYFKTTKGKVTLRQMIRGTTGSS
jgi:putative endonuclease